MVRSVSSVAILALILTFGPRVRAQEAAEYFKANCATCHTIGGGRLTGPDLKDVEKRKDRGWLTRFILDPQAVLDSGDAYAKKLLEEARGSVMPKAAGMDRARAVAMLDLIAAESLLERSAFAGVALNDRPLTAEDVRIGRDLFVGRRPLANGAPACTACHAVEGLGGLGGGLLGPDLSDAYARMQGRKALGAWLLAPATPTMAPVFKDHPLLEDEEILPLLAFLEDRAALGRAVPARAGIDFIVLGIAGTLVSLLLLDAFWRRRFTGVRRSLVKGHR